MYIPDRYRKLKSEVYYVIASLVFLVILLELLPKSSNSPFRDFPDPPKQPAHLPYKQSPTWDPTHEHKRISQLGMVVSDSERCSQLGSDILSQGGNAADAAITVCLCIGATDTMYSSGIGGGSFITAKLHNESSAISIDSREMAPGKAHKDMYKHNDRLSKTGGLAVAIPGELMGLWTLHEMHGSGKFSWEDLVMPVSDLVTNGWNIDIRLAFGLEMLKENLEFFNDDWQFVHHANGSIMKEGDLMKRVAYGKTLRKIAQHGVQEFYNPQGEIAQSLSKKAQEWGGVLTAEDFGHYKVVVQDAIKVQNFTNENFTVFTSSGSSSGLALASALKVLDNFPVELENEKEDFGEQTHKLIEAMKWLSSVRSNLGDINVTNKNQTERELHNDKYQSFLSEDFVQRASSKFNSNHTLPIDEYEPAFEPNDPHGTSSLSVVDQWGNAVTLTTTVNLLFGSMVHDPETGVILNNEMDDFSQPGVNNAFGLAPSVFNYIEPYKRPLSSSAQSIVVNSEGELELVVGAAGGSRICTAILQAIVRTFVYGKDIVDVIANPRLHHQLIPNVVAMEPTFNEQIVDTLKDKNHDVTQLAPASAMNAIRVEKGVMIGQGDFWRKKGQAVGV